MSLINNIDLILIIIINIFFIYIYYKWTAARGGYNGVI